MRGEDIASEFLCCGYFGEQFHLVVIEKCIV